MRGAPAPHYGALLDQARRALARLPADEAMRDARLLLGHAAGVSQGRLLAMLSDPAPADLVARFEALLRARTGGLSVAHITGRVEFYGRAFVVGAGDLAPRPDTETLIEAALEAPFERVCDLGTGTGIIAITLLAENPAAFALATDIAPQALASAARNAATHAVDHRLTLAQGDWWGAVAGRFDLICSNPPYIDAATYAGLAVELRQGERWQSLTDGGDGLAAYRAIAAGALRHLAPQGRLIVEIGHDQGQSVPQILAQAGLTDIAVKPDLAGKARVVCARGPA